MTKNVSDIFSFNWGVKSKYIFVLSIVIIFLGTVLTKNILLKFQREILERNLRLEGDIIISSVVEAVRTSLLQKEDVKTELRTKLNPILKNKIISYLEAQQDKAFKKGGKSLLFTWLEDVIGEAKNYKTEHQANFWGL